MRVARALLFQRSDVIWNRAMTSRLVALLALASALVLVVTAVRATRCARAAAVVTRALAIAPVALDGAAVAPSGEAPTAPASDDDTGRACQGTPPIPAQPYAPALARAASLADVPASDAIPPERAPEALERPPRS